MGLLIALRNPNILAFFRRVYSVVISWFPTSSACSLWMFSLTSLSMNLMLSSCSMATCYSYILPSNSNLCRKLAIKLSKYRWEIKLFACMVIWFFCITILTRDSMVSGPIFRIWGIIPRYRRSYSDLFYRVLWLNLLFPCPAGQEGHIRFHQLSDKMQIPRDTVWPWSTRLSSRKAGLSFPPVLPSVLVAAFIVHRQYPCYTKLVIIVDDKE